MGAFLYIIGDMLFLQCGLAFGADFSPAAWEPIRRLSETLAENLFKDKSLINKHKRDLDKLNWREALGKLDKLPIQAKQDSQNQRVLDKNGNPVNCPHHFFVDDGIYVDVFDQ